MQNGLKHKIILLLLLSTLLAAKDTIVHSLSIVHMNMDYREYDKNDKILDSEKSEYIDISGFYYDTGYMFNKKGSYDKLSFSILYLGGVSEYKDSSRDSNADASVVRTSQHSIIDAQLTYNKAYLIGKSVAISGGIGLGYRYWDRILSKSQSNVYKWSSVRPNVGLIYNLGNNYLLQTSLEYQYGIEPIMIDEEDIEFKLGSANILQADVLLRLPITNTVDISLQYTYQVQDIQALNIANSVDEPSSTAKNQYLKIGVIIRY